jgi:hypothetical protein
MATCAIGELYVPPGLELLPPIMRRDVSETSGWVDTDAAMTCRYMQYECKYRACKYPNVTWGALAQQDYQHFLDLMSTEVPADSNTFVALRSELRPEDVEAAMTTTRTRDTTEGKNKTQKDFLDMKCTHKGRMNGKSWHAIRETDYSYFVWSVGNTMTRDTTTYKVLSSCLDTAGAKLVNSSTKGQVKVQRNMKYVQA